MKFADQFSYEDNIVIHGLTEELSAFYVYQKFNKINDNMLLVTNSLLEANNIYERLFTYTNNVKLFPMDDFISYKADARSPELETKRLEILKTIDDNNKIILVTNLTGFLKKLPNKIDINKKIVLTVNSEIDRDKFISSLLDYGYRKESLVTITGEFAIRGYIIDIFLTGTNHPIRIELNGNYIESIREFDESTQISTKKLETVNIFLAKENLVNVNSNLLELLGNPMVVYYDYDQLEYSINNIETEIVNNDLNNIFNLYESYNISRKVYFNFTDNVVNGYKNITYSSQKMQKFNNNFDLFYDFIKKKIQEKKSIYICLSKEKQINEIKEVLKGLNNINFIKCEINEGYIFENNIVISEYDLDKSLDKKTNYSSTFKMGKKIKSFNDLKNGDYVVHTLYGIGIYNGVVAISKNGLVKDYIQIIYKDNDKVYIPVEKIETLFKYNSEEGVAPKINKLGTTTWEKAKLATRKKISDITAELINLYAKRLEITTEPYKNYPEISVFDEEFTYDETIDQTKAIEDVYKDLASNVCMDRLLCGDVGFGKTEVAFRAMFKTVINGFQVAYLCPTTILSKQQYNNALERFSKHAINIKLLNRFITEKEKKEIILGLKEGTIDIIIGTHRLLSKDIEFKKLGLLIVDEEQRFGVEQKEKIKQLKTNVNILTLSATPIPRTMKFAMAGLRDMSVIDTPPVNRYPVQTYVIKEDDMLIKDAIYKELSRQGQVYILFNNVSNIEKKLNQLKNLCPLASFNYAHGKMNKIELDNIMSDFIERKFDVLVCTTIIETGMDISNVNTLIVYDADRFGLSQLYQLRGRVGRGDRIAFAYLLYDKSKMLNDIAIKRLKAIKEFTELGSGYKIAMRDMALRGAGDLLGSEQAGFVNSVGIDMYLKMLEEEINRQKGIAIADNDNKENLIDVETHISDEYVSDESIKIEIHKLINTITNKENLLKIKNEIEDRFGHVNEKLIVYMYEQLFEKLAQKFNINNVIQTNKYISFTFDEEISSTIPGDKLLLLANNLSRDFKIYYKKNKITITLFYHKLKRHFIYYLVELLSGLL